MASARVALARQSLEDSIPELEEALEHELVSSEEVRVIIRKRAAYELRIRRRGALWKDFERAIEFEKAFQELRMTRASRLGVTNSSCPRSAFSAVRRALRLYELWLRKHPGDRIVWNQYLRFAIDSDSARTLGSAFAKSVQLHPDDDGLWVLAARHQFEKVGNANTARVLFQQGLRVKKSSPYMWISYLHFEVSAFRQLQGRQSILQGKSLSESHFLSQSPTLDLFEADDRFQGGNGDAKLLGLDDFPQAFFRTLCSASESDSNSAVCEWEGRFSVEKSPTELAQNTHGLSKVFLIVFSSALESVLLEDGIPRLSHFDSGLFVGNLLHTVLLSGQIDVVCRCLLRVAQFVSRIDRSQIASIAWIASLVDVCFMVLEWFSLSEVMFQVSFDIVSEVARLIRSSHDQQLNEVSEGNIALEVKKRKPTEKGSEVSSSSSQDLIRSNDGTSGHLQYLILSFSSVCAICTRRVYPNSILYLTEARKAIHFIADAWSSISQSCSLRPILCRASVLFEMCKMEEILCGENSDHADLQAWNMSSKLFFGAFPFLPAAIQCRRAFLLHTFSSRGFEGLPSSHATIDTTFSFLLGMDALTRISTVFVPSLSKSHEMKIPACSIGFDFPVLPSDRLSHLLTFSALDDLSLDQITKEANQEDKMKESVLISSLSSVFNHIVSEIVHWIPWNDLYLHRKDIRRVLSSLVSSSQLSFLWNVQGNEADEIFDEENEEDNHEACSDALDPTNGSQFYLKCLKTWLESPSTILISLDSILMHSVKALHSSNVRKSSKSNRKSCSRGRASRETDFQTTFDSSDRGHSLEGACFSISPSICSSVLCRCPKFIRYLLSTSVPLMEDGGLSCNEDDPETIIQYLDATICTLRQLKKIHFLSAVPLSSADFDLAFSPISFLSRSFANLVLEELENALSHADQYLMSCPNTGIFTSVSSRVRLLREEFLSLSPQ